MMTVVYHTSFHTFERTRTRGIRYHMIIVMSLFSLNVSWQSNEVAILIPELRKSNACSGKN